MPYDNIELFLGPQVVVNILSAFLSGVATVQVYLYYFNFREDGILFRMLVGLLWLLDITHTVMTSAAFYEICISYFGHPEKFDRAPNVLIAAIFLASAIYLIVQGFLSYRVCALVPIRILGAICWIMTLVRSGSVIALGIGAVKVNSLHAYSKQYSWLLTLSITMATTGDLLTAIILSWSLWRQKAGLLEATSRVVDRLIIWTMQTGILISMATTSLLVCFLTMPRNWIWVSILSIVPRLYTNSLLSSLNGRLGFKTPRNGQYFCSTDQLTGGRPTISIEMNMTHHHIDVDPPSGHSESPKSAMYLYPSSADLSSHYDNKPQREAGNEWTHSRLA